MKITGVHARQILDSRGNPTIEAEVTLENGVMGRASVPSGASTGSKEALELRDNDANTYLGKGDLKAVENVNGPIAQLLNGSIVEDQEKIDRAMIDLDGTENKSKLGANAILAVSLATAKASALSSNVPLFQYIHTLSKTKEEVSLPLPMMNIINGGMHAHFATDIQEFMIVPVGAKNFSDALRMGADTFHYLGKVLTAQGYPTTVGDEGGYALTSTKKDWNGNVEAMSLIKQAVENAGYAFAQDIALALDIAATELYKDGMYTLKSNNWELDSAGMIDALEKYCNDYPIISIEDGLSESDWDGWKVLTERLGSRIQLVGDDLLVTNTKFLQKAIQEKSANAILIKPNQIGTLTETVQAVRMAKDAGWNTIMSHRSGETEDTTIAHLAVGLATGQIKTGSLSHTDRIAKYNELLRIEEILGEKAVLATPFK